MRLRLFARTVLVTGITAVAGNTALCAQDRSTNIGARAGYNFETDELVVSANLVVPMTSRVDFYPSVDIYRPERGNKIGFNTDVKIRFPKLGEFFYAGFGAGVISRTVGDSSHTEWGGNLLLGLQARIGWLRPFAEARAMFRDAAQLQAVGGFNISRGP
jgi:hypothetical protein